MPKNKKPAGGRAQNFEPRYGKKTSYQDAKRRPGQASAGTAGSKSPKHRGFRAAEESAPAKGRWTEQDRAGRAEARGIRSHARGDRAAGGERPRFERAGGGERPRFDRERGAERPRFDRERGNDRGDFDRRGPRGADSRRDGQDVRGYGRPERDDRARFGRTERPRFDRADRGNDRGDSDRRAPRDAGSGRDAREFRGTGRPERPRFDRADRTARSFDERPRRDDRPRRDERANRSDWAHAAGGSARRGSGAWSGRGEKAAEKSKAHQEHVDVVHERLQAEAVDAASVEQASFADLGLGQNIVRTLEGLGATSPFPIQAATVRPILEGRDVLARGRTGSGKTIAFGAPLVERVLRGQAGKRRAWGRSPQALILAPTRELALQIDRTVQELAQSVGLFTTQVYGGVPQGRQVGALKKGVDIVIGTPGRIEDLEKQGKLDLSEVGIVVLDEADHMSELGFLEPMQRILRLVQDDAQKLLFSATLDREVAALVDEFLVNPAVYEVAGETQETSTIDHRVLVIDHRDKAEILTSLVDRDGKTLVFTRTRAYSEMLVEQFEDAGIAAVALHGDLNQAKRTRNLQRLTDGKVNVLVATDVAARGIHVDDIDLVVQADAPDEYKTYTHRSGRTGRAGRAGTVVTLITRQRRRRMTEMLERAEIDAPFDEARIGDDVLEEITGRQAANVDA